MFQYKYLLIGGGMSADSAAKGIRDSDQEGTIGLVGQEADPPYERPPLSKNLWKGHALDEIWRQTDQKGVTLHLGRRIVALDAARLVARDDQGDEYQAEKILLATGGTPRRLPYGGDEIIYFRTLADYRRLAELAASRQTFAIIGGGFIGAEVAAGLAMNGKTVTMIFPKEEIGARIYPADLAFFISNYFRNKGVEVLSAETVTGMDPAGNGRSRKASSIISATTGSAGS